MNKTAVKILFFISFIGGLAFAEMGVPIQLKLKSPSGVYPTASGLEFKLLVLSSASNCILREEIFSNQSITDGRISLSLGSGARGVSDPNLSLNQVYDNSKPKTGLSCIDANNNVTATGQSYTPTSIDQRTIRVVTSIASDLIIVNFNMRATPYAIQAESVGGKVAADIVVNDITTQMNQTNLNDLLFDITRFNNLKNFAISGQASAATNFTGTLVGDVGGTQGATSVDRIKGIAVSAAAPVAGDVLQYNGVQYVPVAIPSALVSSVAGRTGAVVLSNSDIAGLGGAALLSVGTGAGSVAAGDDSRIVNAANDTTAATSANTAGAIVKRDASGNISVANISSTNNSTNNIYLYDGTNSVRVKAPVGLTASYVLTLPDEDGANGQVMQTDGAGNLSWVNAGSAVTSVAGRTGAVVLSNSDISGLGGAAILNVGTGAGSVAAGDDSRINGALQSSAFNTYVASASCTNSQSMYWNSVISQFQCQAINFPADAVSSVAGRTGAVVLSNSDISGLGGAALLNVGAGAGSVAAGDDSRLSDARTPTGAASGDLSGTYPNPTVAANAITSAKILDGTITNSDISATAAIDAAKVGVTGLVSNAEYDFLDGVTSSIQTQLNARLPLAGGTMTGTLVTRAPAAAAGSASLKLPAGTVMTTPEAGAVESNGTILYYTDSAGVRRVVPLETVITKTVTQNVNNSTVLVSDNAFTFVAAANTRYNVKIIIKCNNANNAMNIKWTFLLPSGTMEVSGINPSGATATAGSWVSGASLTLPSPIPSMATTANNQIFIIEGLISVGATGGNVTFQWAQNAAVAANLSFMAGSYMVYKAE